MKEFDFIAGLRQHIAVRDDVPIGPGDDAAHARFATPDGWLYTVDMLMDGVHFRVGECGAYLAGRKAMAVNLSDIAAMGGQALGALIAVALPRTGGARLATDLFQGMADLAAAHGVAILGGDTNSWEGALCVSVTVVGAPHPKGAVRRNGARAGDVVYVTGPLGGSLAGHHLHFTPRLAEAKTLMDHVKPHAMIDLSDGLSSDAAHLARESGVRIVLRGASLPLTEEARRDADPLARALHDGEDFELCLCLDPLEAAHLERQGLAGVALHRVGYVTAGAGLFLEEADGAMRPLAKSGYEHEFSP